MPNQASQDTPGAPTGGLAWGHLFNVPNGEWQAPVQAVQYGTFVAGSQPGLAPTFFVTRTMHFTSQLQQPYEGMPIRCPLASIQTRSHAQPSGAIGAFPAWLDLYEPAILEAIEVLKSNGPDFPF